MIEGPGPSLDPLEAGRRLFARECRFRFAAGSSERLPPSDLPEIAFAGRSNAGKSSLINALTGRHHLARTSRTPGRTQELIFFELGGEVMLVDMPGYGYAAAPVETVKTWSEFARDYVRGRPNLYRVYVLADARHGLKPADLSMLDILDKAAVSYQLVLTKADEVRAKDQPARLADVQAALARRPAAYPGVVLTSSRTGAGLPELRAAVARLLSERA
ncbi:MAG: YihA family ribosome biogenesis GTP-binding protein [Hyphomicrobiales bacterium]|nr:YihA family ribosome biogenesis GTP-binding protein [Hyphomicrobiales bacterium]